MQGNFSSIVLFVSISLCQQWEPRVYINDIHYPQRIVCNELVPFWTLGSKTKITALDPSSNSYIAKKRLQNYVLMISSEFSCCWQGNRPKCHDDSSFWGCDNLHPLFIFLKWRGKKEQFYSSFVFFYVPSVSDPSSV